MAARGFIALYPNEAIFRGESIFVIDRDLGTECVGIAHSQGRADVCPMDGCGPDPTRFESEGVLIERARKLHPQIYFGEDSKSRFGKQ